MTGPGRIQVMGCPFDPVTMTGALARIDRAMASGGQLRHTALNTAKLVRMRRDPELAGDVRSSALVTADGMGILLAARLLGRALPERVTGIDLMTRTLALCARAGYRPYLLGGRQCVVDLAVGRALGDHPGLVVAGWRDGYFGAADEDGIVAAINRAQADCLFVGLPTPMKERFLARNAERLRPRFIMGVGGSFDVLAGRVRRAPRWMQRAGLEWLHRTWQEPRRMWRRYLVTNAVFAVWLVSALACRLAGVEFRAPVSPSSSAEGAGH